MTTMRDANDSISESELDRLRDLRATTMIRLSADRIHQNYVAGTLDPMTTREIDDALTELRRLGGEVAREKSATVVSTSVGRLADALDADDHVAGQAQIRIAAPTMVAMAILAGWEVGSLSPF
ncbi:MAG TPA: hypothetical protein VFV72_01090 [Candidatus Limnocylindrales bacterium]|nr:hypothetical protein [Candidatus Limnocylindrales bacterium]